MNHRNFVLLTVSWILPILAPTTLVLAHDSWLIANRNSVNEDDDVWLSFVTGEVFPFGDAATDPDRVASFVDRRGAEINEVTGFAPEDNALSVRRSIRGKGLHVIGCALKPTIIELEAETFDEYLAGEQANKAIALRKSSNRSERVVERYTKFAKTIVEVFPADPGDAGYETPIGHRLEIIPLSNPIDWQAHSTIRIKVLLDGHPWPDVPVSVGHEGGTVVLSNRGEDHAYAARTRTDDEGIASVELTRPGHWFIKAHLIRRSSGLASYDWESFWASLTFRVQGRMDIGGDIQAMKVIHGELTPWVVAGYRMGKRALRELSLPHGSLTLQAIHKTPLETPYATIADGIQAATGATVGKMNLRLERVPAGDRTELRSEFANKTSGRMISFRLRDELVKSMLEGSPDASETLAMKMMTMDDEEIFVITRTNRSTGDMTGSTSTPPREAGSSTAVRGNSQ